jgi:hypothetical protein
MFYLPPAKRANVKADSEQSNHFPFWIVSVYRPYPSLQASISLLLQAVDELSALPHLFNLQILCSQYLLCPLFSKVVSLKSSSFLFT